MSKLQLTLAILKPHILKYPFAFEEIRNIILTSNFKIVKSKKHRITMKEACKFYEEHRNKFFYNRLVTFMTSGESDLYILACQDAIKDWRQLMGPTKVYKAQYEAPDTIRGKFGLSDTRNATHGSDSEESAAREISIFFPTFNIEKWYKNEEEAFRLNNVKLINEDFVHVPVDNRDSEPEFILSDVKR